MRGYAAFMCVLAVLGNLHAGQAQVGLGAPTVNQVVNNLCAPLSWPQLPSKVIAEREQRDMVLVQVLQSRLAQMGDIPVATALHGIIPCLKVTMVPGDDQVAAVELTLDSVWLAGDHLVYWDGSAWRIEPLRVERWPRYIEPKLAARTRKGLELIAHGDGGGSGGTGMLQFYRLGKDMDLLWEGTPSGDHLSVFPLSMDYVITIDRSPQTYEEPHAYQANCCLPVDRETLWHRLDHRYRSATERLIPTPYRAVSLFVGALRAGDKLLAAQHATRPELAEQGAQVIQEIDYFLWGSMDRGWEIELQEALSWDVIPPHLRRPEPKIRRMVWPAGKYDLVTERKNYQWKVSEIRPTGLP